MKDWVQCDCPIWGSPALRNPLVLGDEHEYYSARAGGKFRISGTAEAMDKTYKQVALSSLIFEENVRGLLPTISSEEISRATPSETVPVRDKYNRFLICTAHLFPKLGQKFQPKDLWAGRDSWVMQAALGVDHFFDGAAREEVEMLTDEALGLGHIYKFNPSGLIRLNLSGHRYVNELGISLNKSDQVFVAMWFGSDEQTKLYNESIAPAIRDAGYAPVRIDNTEHNEKIDDQIIAEIRKSKAVVVDLTCGLAKPEGWSKSDRVGSPRGGVFYEAGFAKGLGLPVIWTVKADIADIENVVHFDIRQFNQIRWNSDLSEFREKLRFRIEATLGRGNFDS